MTPSAGAVDVAVAGARLRFAARSADDLASLRLAFEGFVSSDAEIDATRTTTIELTHPFAEAGHFGGSALVMTRTAPDELVVTGGGARALIDLRRRHAELSAAPPSFVHAVARLLLARALLDEGALLVHASAIVTTHGAGFVFVGPSGVGKTTVATTLAPALSAVIAADEAVVLAPSPEGVMVRGTPWWKGRPIAAPVCALCFLARGPGAEWLPLSRGHAAARLAASTGPLPDSDLDRALTSAASLLEALEGAAQVTLPSRAHILSWLSPRLNERGTNR